MRIRRTTSVLATCAILVAGLSACSSSPSDTDPVKADPEQTAEAEAPPSTPMEQFRADIVEAFESKDPVKLELLIYPTGDMMTQEQFDGAVANFAGVDETPTDVKVTADPADPSLATVSYVLDGATYEAEATGFEDVWAMGVTVSKALDLMTNYGYSFGAEVPDTSSGFITGVYEMTPPEPVYMTPSLTRLIAAGGHLPGTGSDGLDNNVTWTPTDALVQASQAVMLKSFQECPTSGKLEHGSCGKGQPVSDFKSTATYTRDQAQTAIMQPSEDQSDEPSNLFWASETIGSSDGPVRLEAMTQLSCFDVVEGIPAPCLPIVSERYGTFAPDGGYDAVGTFLVQ